VYLFNLKKRKMDMPKERRIPYTAEHSGKIILTCEKGDLGKGRQKLYITKALKK